MRINLEQMSGVGMEKIFKEYLNKISEITRRGDARFEEFFSFVLPSALTAESLSRELARRKRFLRDEVIRPELQQKQRDVYGFYEAFKKFLISGLSEDEFAYLYAQNYLHENTGVVLSI